MKKYPQGYTYAHLPILFTFGFAKKILKENVVVFLVLLEKKYIENMIHKSRKKVRRDKTQERINPRLRFWLLEKSNVCKKKNK